MSHATRAPADAGDGAGPDGASSSSGSDAQRSNGTKDAEPDDGGESNIWTKSKLGVLVVVVDLVLLGVLVVGTLGLLTDGANVEPYVYVFAAMGALGYVFTGLVKDYKRETGEILHMNLRIPAALPLGVGLFLLAGQFLGEDPPARLIAGLAFLAGLFVNLSYARIGALAKRLLPNEGDEEQSETEDASGGNGTGRATGTRDGGRTADGSDGIRDAVASGDVGEVVSDVEDLAEVLDDVSGDGGGGTTDGEDGTSGGSDAK